jgi:hypothetical protein
MVLDIILEILSTFTATGNNARNLDRNFARTETELAWLPTIMAVLLNPFNNAVPFPFFKALLAEMSAERAFMNGLCVDRGLSFVANLTQHTTVG